MRRRLLFWAWLLTLLLLCGCVYAANTQSDSRAYFLFFQEADLTNAQGRDALREEKIYLPASETAPPVQLAETLLKELLRGPLDETLKTPIPSGTSLLSVQVTDAKAVVDLSASYSTLSGIHLTMADYCIALTLTQLPEIRVVKITVRGQDLAYRNHQTFSVEDVLLSSTEDVVSTLEATLYFLNEDGLLTPETQTLDLYEGDTQVRAVLQGLQRGPNDKKLTQALPEGFKVKSVWLDGATCYANLPSAASQNMGEHATLSTAIQALTRSLCSLDSVEEVQFLVDGEFAGSYGAVSIARPYHEF